VTKNLSTGAAQFGPPATVNVASYSMPPSAPQKGTPDRLDTMDGRLTNAVTAIDPVNGGNLAVWTQQTVYASAGGLRAEVRWYEINPASGSLIQNGVVHHPYLWIFNGAVSSDRNGAAGVFGGNMVVAINASASFLYPAVGTVSKIGASAQSIIAWVSV